MKNYKWILFFSLSILALLLPKTTTAINCVGGSTVTCESTDGNDSILVTRCDAPATDCVRIIDQDGVFFNFDPTMTAVSVDALGGSDEIQVDLDLNNDFVGNISIMGSDPTASDLLILNGSTVQDFIEVAPTAIDGAGVEDSTGLSLTFGTIERFIYNGQGGTTS